MNAVEIIEAAAIRDTLLDIPEIVALVAWEIEPGNIQYKLFWEDVPDSVPMPYIVYNSTIGGEDLETYPSRADETIWRIYGVTNDMMTAVALKNAIDTLHRKMPIVNDPDACPFKHFVRKGNYFDRKSLQNVTNISTGGYYEIGISLRSITSG